MRGQNRSYLPSLENRATRKGFRTAADRAAALRQSRVGVHRRLDARHADRSAAARRALRHRRPQRRSSCSRPRAVRPGGISSFKNHLIPSGVQAARHVLLLPRHQHDGHDVPSAEPPRRSARRSGAPNASRRSTPSSRRANAARGRRVDRALNRAYEVDTTYAWLHPTIRRWYAFWKYPDPSARLHFENVDRGGLQPELPARSRRRHRRRRGRRRLRARSAVVRAAAHHGAGAARTSCRSASCACSGARSAISRRRNRRRCRDTSPTSAPGPNRAGRVLPRRHRRSRDDARSLRGRRSRPRPASATRGSSGAGWIRSSDDVSQPAVRHLLPGRPGGVLAVCRTAARTCCCWPPATCSTAGSIRGSSRSCWSRRPSTTGPASGWRTIRRTSGAISPRASA